MTDVVTLAVLNNPRLKADRLRLGIAHAQLLQAGLLPEPEVQAGFSHPTAGPPPLVNGYSAGLMEDLSAIITRHDRRAQARARGDKVRLDILWDEWQVAYKAQQLYIRIRAQAREMRVLGAWRHVCEKTYRSDLVALKHGELTTAQLAVDQARQEQASAHWWSLKRRQYKTWLALDALLGLQPGVEPKLAGKAKLPSWSAADFHKALMHMPERRPDLQALQAGYRSQEARVRQAILQQFPALSLGISRGQDTQNVQTIGFAIHLTLPLFGQAHARIAIARATRAYLHKSYQDRLDEAVNQVHELHGTSALLRAQLRKERARWASLRTMDRSNRQSFDDGMMDTADYLDTHAHAVAVHMKVITLEAQLRRAQSDLALLLGQAPCPNSTLPSGPTG
ncbi:TolC family protein [Oleiagrimonas sp. C23AA]|uniref:TolC family protein n=1 Tax=Oleiagrimonas sp. C23AA TaxID=2719047 RepID=UPI00141E0706|nr:TolC family protein [Oleiagrimonas sp. C23AA]NII11184.1 TolC family protein [Oleiagrimonas sp. C23AA]